MVSGFQVRVTRRWLLPALVATVLIVGLAAGAAAAIETDTVQSYWGGLWWSISLITTVGFIGEPPNTAAGALSQSSSWSEASFSSRW